MKLFNKIVRRRRLHEMVCDELCDKQYGELRFDESLSMFTTIQIYSVPKIISLGCTIVTCSLIQFAIAKAGRSAGLIV